MMIRDLQFTIRSRFEEIQIVFDGISILFAISSLSFYGIILCTYIYVHERTQLIDPRPLISPKNRWIDKNDKHG